MLDQLIQLVKDNTEDSIANNPVIPVAQKNEAVSATASTIFDTLKEQATAGNFGNLVSLFQGGNPTVVSAITAAVTNMLSEKFGVNGSQAAGTAMDLVPKIIGSLTAKAKDPNDSSFDLNSIFSALTNGKTSGVDMNGVLKNFKGGDLDINNLGSLLGNVDAGDLFNKAKGFFS